MAGRGIDFEHRFNTSRWAEDLLLRSLNAQEQFVAVRFGISAVRDARSVVFDRTGAKEPDLLVYLRATLSAAEVGILANGDLSCEAREKFNSGGALHFAIAKATAAIEVEFSPYRAAEMKGRSWIPKTEAQWGRRPLIRANPPIAPNIWVKEEDLPRLIAWQAETNVPIFVVHLFDQESFAVSLSRVKAFSETFDAEGSNQIKLQMTTGIFKKDQSYDRQDAQGAGEHKMCFVISPAVATKVGDVTNVTVRAQLGESASKKYVTHSIFSGGAIAFTAQFLEMLAGARR
jgi:hypothetical protein